MRNRSWRDLIISVVSGTVGVHVARTLADSGAAYIDVANEENMTEEISARLGEIVDLLRQRLALEERSRERNEEQRKRSEIAIARLREEGPKLPDFTEFRKAGLGPEHDERMKRIEERAEEDRQERREFNQRLLAELERHNRILEAILARAENGSKT